MKGFPKNLDFSILIIFGKSCFSHFSRIEPIFEFFRFWGFSCFWPSKSPKRIFKFVKRPFLKWPFLKFLKELIQSMAHALHKVRRDHFISFFFSKGQKYLALVSFDPNEKNFCL